MSTTIYPKPKPPSMICLFPFSELFANCRDYPIGDMKDYHELKTISIPPIKHWTQKYSYYGLMLEKHEILG